MQIQHTSSSQPNYFIPAKPTSTDHAHTNPIYNEVPTFLTHPNPCNHRSFMSHCSPSHKKYITPPSPSLPTPPHTPNSLHILFLIPRPPSSALPHPNIPVKLYLAKSITPKVRYPQNAIIHKASYHKPPTFGVGGISSPINFLSHLAWLIARIRWYTIFVVVDCGFGG